MTPDAENEKKIPYWLDTLVSLVQPLSIVIGGCWIAFLYFTYQEKADKADLTSKQLSIQQAQILLQTQQQSNKLDLDLKKLSLDQARITLETQQTERELNKAQLATEVELKKQEVILNRLKEKQQEHDVEYSNSYRSSYEMTLRAVKLKESNSDINDYRVSVDFSLKNESTVRYELSYLAVEYYSGRPNDSNEKSAGEVRFALIGTPPSIVNSEAESGDIEWFRIAPPNASVWSLAAEDLGSWDFLIDPSVKFNGANTGPIVPGGKTQFSYDYIVRARPGTYLGFVVDWIINRGKVADDVNYVNRIVELPSDKTEIVVNR